MKNFLPIILSLFIGISAYAIEVTNEAYLELVYGREFDRFEAFINACNYMEKDCASLPPPHLVWGPLRGSLVGKYDGKGTIYVVEGLYGYDRKAVLMHESIHYIQNEIDGLVLPGKAELLCQAENQAFTLTDAWLREQGQYQYIVGPEWWKNYSYCKPFFDPDYTAFDPRNIWNSIIF